MATKLYAGVDVGGTKIAVVIADTKGRVLGRAKRKSRAERGFEAVMKRVGKTVREACEDADVPLDALRAVGAGVPSPVRDGVAVAAPNMGWADVPLVSALRAELGRPVFAENDCNAGALGEHALGAGRGAESLVALFVGTGLGGGFVHRGELVAGVNGLAGEWGHVKVVVDGRACGCGGHGCLEAYASKAGMSRRLHAEIVEAGRPSLLTELTGGEYSKVRGGQLAQAWRAGDEVARETLLEAARFLGVGVANLVTSLGPDVVVLGGGVFEALGEALLPTVRAAAAAHTHPPRSFADTSVVLAGLGDDAVALGAVVVARARSG